MRLPARQQLIATSVHYLKNLQPGQTGYQTVTVRITQGDFPDHADCRMSLKSGRTVSVGTSVVQRVLAAS
jgi:hypothetical protein